tara:strand:+ start:659 stop:997 length:339 start_codon:yes stop_codon:yes gene_type:complete
MKTASLYKDLKFDEHKPVITVLFETTFTKEIRIAMQKGTKMKEHKTPFSIVVEIVDGNIDFGVNGDNYNLLKGRLIALDGNVPHDLEAKEDSIIRLTLTKNDEINRVKNIIE